MIEPILGRITAEGMRILKAEEERQFPPPVPGTEWAPRKKALGGMDIAAILGKNPFKSRWQVWAEKTRRLPREPQTEIMRWGAIHEPIILDEYERQEEVKLIRLRNVLHPAHLPEHMVASIDAMRPDKPRMVEAKAPSHWQLKKYGEPGTDAIPEVYLIQNIWNVGALKLEGADCPTLFGGNDFRIYKVEQSERLFGMLYEAGDRFWREHIQADEPPPMGAGEGEKRFLRELRHVGRELRPATAEERAYVETLAKGRDQLERWKEHVEALTNEVKRRIGEEDGLEGEDFRITWHQAAGAKKVDWETVARRIIGELNVDPEYVKEVVAWGTRTEAGSRRFLVKGPLFENGGGAR